LHFKSFEVRSSSPSWSLHFSLLNFGDCPLKEKRIFVFHLASRQLLSQSRKPAFFYEVSQPFPLLTEIYSDDIVTAPPLHLELIELRCFFTGEILQPIKAFSPDRPLIVLHACAPSPTTQEAEKFSGRSFSPVNLFFYRRRADSSTFPSWDLSMESMPHLIMRPSFPHPELAPPLQ